MSVSGELRGGIARRYREKAWELTLRALFEDTESWGSVGEIFKSVVATHFETTQHKRHVSMYIEVLGRVMGVLKARGPRHMTQAFVFPS